MPITDTPLSIITLLILIWRHKAIFSKTGIDIGSLAFSAGMVMVTNAIAIGQAEARALYALQAAGLKVFAQKVPTDKRVDVMPLLAKNGFMAPDKY